MTKTNNNKLKILVFFFIGLGWSHQAMEDNNNKRTHSQRQDNEDEITQIDTTSRQRIKVDNPIDTISTIIHPQPIGGFVNKLEDADMTQERLSVGKLTNISDHFSWGNTIGERNTCRQILNPNVFYTMDYDYEPMGPFKNTKVLIFPNQQTIKEETPLVDLNQLRTLSIEFIELMVGFEKNRFLSHHLKRETYQKLLTLLKKQIEDVNNPLFQQLFQWINGKLQSTLYEPNKDFSKIEATHKSNFFEDVVKNFNKVNQIKDMLIDENFDLLIFKMDEIDILEAKSELEYQRESENLMAISKQLRQRYEISNVQIEENLHSFLLDMEKKPQLFLQYSVNDGLMMMFFHTLLKDWNSKVKDMEDFLLCFKSTKQVFSIISPKKLFINRKSQVSDLRYNDIDPLLKYMEIRMHNDNLKIFHTIKKPIIMDPLDVILNIFDLQEDFIKNKIYSSFEEHVLLDGYSDDESMGHIESSDGERQKGLGILVNSDDFFLAACCPKWIYGINYCNLLMGKATSPQLDKMFLNDEYNRNFHEIMGGFQVHSVCDLLFKDLKEAKLMSIDGYNGLFDIIDNFSTLYNNAPKQIRNLTTAAYELAYPFQGTESFNFWHKNREVRPDIVITTLLYNASPENKVNLNLENTLLMLAMADINFFKKFLTTFKKLYGQMLINYSQYNLVDPDNPDFNLGARNILDWQYIFETMGKKLINKYPNGFSHNPSIDPKISAMELKQAHGEFLLHMNKILVELLLKSFSETDDAEECFAHHPKDQNMFRSYQELIKINIGAIKKNIKKVVYWSYENGSDLSHGENSHNSNDEMVNDLDLSGNVVENSDNILLDSLNHFPVNDNVYGDQVMDELDPNQNNWPLDMINNSGQNSQRPQKIIEYDLPAAPILDNSYEVYKDLLGKTCDFSKGNFDNEKLIEFVNNQVDLAVYKIPISFWDQDSTKLDIIFEKNNIDKGFQQFIKIFMEIKIIKDLLKETIAQGLCSKDEDSTAVTIYTTDPAVDAVFNFGLRKTEIDGGDHESQEDDSQEDQSQEPGIQLTNENTTFYLIQKAITEFSYKISKSLPMDVRAINHLAKNQCTIDPSHVEACKFLKVLIQGRQQYVVGNKLKLRNPNDMAIQNCAIPHKMFLSLTGVGVEVCCYILNLPRHIIFALLETMKFQRNVK
jgi:hypothetical protein